MTDKQKQVFEYVRKNGKITNDQADKLIGGTYYYNSRKYVGEILSRMVKSRLLKRVKKGTYVIGERTNPKPNLTPDNQLNLF